VLEQRDLQAFLRAEVREEPGLGHAHVGRQRPDGQPLEADVQRPLPGDLEDVGAGAFAFGLHGAGNSTTVRPGKPLAISH
jgi:hypothetical protein